MTACAPSRRRSPGRTAGAAASRTATTTCTTPASTLQGSGVLNAASAAKKHSTADCRRSNASARVLSPASDCLTPCVCKLPATFPDQLTADVLDAETARHATDLGRVYVLAYLQLCAQRGLRQLVNSIATDHLPRRRVLGRGASV